MNKICIKKNNLPEVQDAILFAVVGPGTSISWCDGGGDEVAMLTRCWLVERGSGGEVTVSMAGNEGKQVLVG